MTQREAPPTRGLGRFTAFRDRVRSTRAGRLCWRIVVTVAGVVVIAGGIVLLAIPGPGWLVIFAGLGLLATEYSVGPAAAALGTRAGVAVDGVGQLARAVRAGAARAARPGRAGRAGLGCLVALRAMRPV